MIIVDTREQLPLWDDLNYKVLRKKLDEGDYTTEFLYNIAHAERKSGIDLYGSLIQGHERFSREINRAIEKDLDFAIFVECSEKKFVRKGFKGGKRLKVPSATLQKIINTFRERYPVQIFWCKDREDMRIKICVWFAKKMVENEGIIDNTSNAQKAKCKKCGQKLDEHEKKCELCLPCFDSSNAQEAKE